MAKVYDKDQNEIDLDFGKLLFVPILFVIAIVLFLFIILLQAVFDIIKHLVLMPIKLLRFLNGN